MSTMAKRRLRSNLALDGLVMHGQLKQQDKDDEHVIAKVGHSALPLLLVERAAPVRVEHA